MRYIQLYEPTGRVVSRGAAVKHAAKAARKTMPSLSLEAAAEVAERAWGVVECEKYWYERAARPNPYWGSRGEMADDDSASSSSSSGSSDSSGGSSSTYCLHKSGYSSDADDSCCHSSGGDSDDGCDDDNHSRYSDDGDSDGDSGSGSDGDDGDANGADGAGGAGGNGSGIASRLTRRKQVERVAKGKSAAVDVERREVVRVRERRKGLGGLGLQLDR